MTIFLTQVTNELSQGHDGPEVSEAKRVYFQRRLRGRLFDFIRDRFDSEEANGLTQAKLARRIGKSPEVINRWLSAPSNLTLDTISDLMIGIRAEELEIGGRDLLNRPRTNYTHLAEFDANDEKLLNTTTNQSQHDQEKLPPILGSSRKPEPASDVRDIYLQRLTANKP
jgi:transcriptional regulator with XRE-family HTH domain